MRKIIKGIIGAMAICCLFTACKQEVTTCHQSFTNYAMGTVTNVTLYGTETKLEDAENSLIDEMKRIEEEEISWRKKDSSLAHINADNTTKVEEPLKTWLETALQIAKDSKGAVDPTIGYLTQAWDFESEHPKAPSETTISNIMDKYKINGNYQRVSISKNMLQTKVDTKLDLGAYGKGIGTDQAYEMLKENENISGGIVALGGSIAVYGEKSDGTDWNVGVQDPSGQQGEVLGSIKAKDGTFISTSGDYEKYFVDETTGKRYFHILDETTGYPVKTDLISCTIVCDSGIVSDGLSTACFSLGIKKSQELLKKYDAKAIFVDQNKKVTVSDGLDFTLVNEAYELAQ